MLQTGDTFRHTFSYTQADVDSFAAISGDKNPLHTDEAAGAASIFGRRVIHGFLGASVFTKVFGSLWYADGHIYLSQTLKWLKPMFTDVQYEAVVTVREIFPEKHRVLYDCTVSELATGEKMITGEAMLLNAKQYVW